MIDISFNYPKYLEAKRTVDERALNGRVWNTFLEMIDHRRSASSARILEVGGGVGATLERVLTRLETAPIDSVEYVLVDHKPANITAARESLWQWARARDYDITATSSTATLFGDNLADVTVQFRPTTISRFAKREEAEQFDAVIAQAVLDLLDIRAVLTQLSTLLRPSGLWYLPIHFDGLTVFEPTIDRELDQKISRLYHQSMRNPETGRNLLTALRQTGAELLEVGSSDWVVHSRNNEYPHREKYFLKCMLGFVYKELEERHEIDSKDVAYWLDERLRQLENGSLILLAHQLDICAQK